MPARVTDRSSREQVPHEVGDPGLGFAAITPPGVDSPGWCQTLGCFGLVMFGWLDFVLLALVF